MMLWQIVKVEEEVLRSTGVRVQWIIPIGYDASTFHPAVPRGNEVTDQFIEQFNQQLQRYNIAPLVLVQEPDIEQSVLQLVTGAQS